MKQSEMKQKNFSRVSRKGSKTVCVLLRFALKRNFFQSEIGTPYPHGSYLDLDPHSCLIRILLGSESTQLLNADPNWIRINKVAECGSYLNPDPQHWRKPTHGVLEVAVVAESGVEHAESTPPAVFKELVVNTSRLLHGK